MNEIKKIVFVCTGNTCRSPMAEGIARREAGRRGLDIEITSAGTDALEGDPVSANSAEACRRIDIDISEHTARVIGEEITEPETLFAVMTWRHAQWLMLAHGVPQERITLLGDGIPDPYGMPLEVYCESCAAIEEAVCLLFDEIEKFMAAKAEQAADREDKIELRPMEPEDAAACAAIEAQCFADAWSERGFAEEAENPLADFIVAEADGEVCGYGGIISAGGISELPKICVAPGFRRRGVADMIMDALERLARTRGSDQLTLEVRVSNEAAIALYEKSGFARMGVRPNFYTSPNEDALIMTKKL